MTLHLYLARRFAIAFMGVFSALFIMLAMIDMVDQIRRFDNADIGFGAIVRLTLLNVPEAVYRILPLVTILAAVGMFVSLSRSSELVVARAAGRSAIVSLLSPVAVAIMIGIAGVAVMNPIVAATTKQYERLADQYFQTGGSVLSVSPEGLWLRQGSASGQTLIRASRADLEGTELFGTTFMDFSTEGIPVSRIEAASARLTPGEWVLTDAKAWDFADVRIAESAAITHETLKIPTDLTREEIADSFGTPSAIPIWELPAFIDRLEAAGFSARQHRVWYHMELALPLLLGSMVLVAAGFTLRPARFGRTGLMVVMAVGLGFSLYFVRNFAQVLGENGQVPALLAAWAPPAAAALLPLGLLLHLEDG